MTAVYRVYAASVGVLPTPGWAVLFRNNDATFTDLFFYVWIVSDGTRIGLIDTGLPLSDMDRAPYATSNRPFGAESGFREVRTLPEVLAEVGIDGADVDFVAITQTVSYHTGGIDAELLPNATFYVAAAGLADMLAGEHDHPSAGGFFTASSWAALRTLAIQRRLRVVDARAEMAAGAVFEVTGGHHPGSATVLLETSRGRTAILETAFLDVNVESGCPIGIAEDIAQARRSMKRYAADCDTVVAIHEPRNAEVYGSDDARRSLLEAVPMRGESLRDLGVVHSPGLRSLADGQREGRARCD